MTDDAFICDYVRTPIGRFGGALASVRADDLAALPIRELMRRHPGLGRQDRRGLSRLREPGGRGQPQRRAHGAPLAGLPDSVPGATVNRLCASGMDAVAAAARGIKAGEIELAIAGGVESMTRAPFVMGKAQAPFQRSAEIFDTTIGWRFVNPPMKSFMASIRCPRRPRTSPTNIRSRAPIRTRSRCARKSAPRRPRRREPSTRRSSRSRSRTARERRPASQGRASARRYHAGGAREARRHRAPGRQRDGGQRFRRQRRRGGAVVASARRRKRMGSSRARASSATRGGRRAARDGDGPIPAVGKLDRAAEAQVIDLRCRRAQRGVRLAGPRLPARLGLEDDADHVNPNGGAIALGHPLGMTGARIAGTPAH